MAITYDRTIRPDLEAALLPGGPARGLVTRHLEQPDLVDLHLRAYPGQARNWVTLYCGLTKPLDLVETRGAFRLKTHRTWQAYAPTLPWNTKLTSAELADLWPQVETYLDVVLPVIRASRWYGKEGAVQTAVTRLEHDGMLVFDREAVPSFTDTPEKVRVMKQEGDLLTRELSSTEAWWKLPRLGEECDATALSSDGQLLAIEVKPGTAGSSSIAWSALQAAYYARLFTRWVDDDAGHAAALTSLMAQRARLGLHGPAAVAVSAPLQVKPVVIIGVDNGGPSKEVRRRCLAVRDEIVARGLVTELPVWTLGAGVLEPLTP